MKLSKLKSILPLSAKKKEELQSLIPFLSEEEVNEVKKLIKKNQASVFHQDLGLSQFISIKFSYPQILQKIEDEETKERISYLNQKIERAARRKAFEAFSREAIEKFPSLIAPNIIGFEDIKKILAIQLFSTERLHILLIGDPAVGKTELIRSSYELSPIGSFGLGSGISKAGLSMTFSGKKLVKGLLPLANGGICAIDELNLIKQDDLGALYNAMEKGFITYDKGDMHKVLSANVCLAATANPKGKVLLGKSPRLIKTQIPFDSALLSRFHILAVMFKPDAKKFAEIAASSIREKDNPLSQKDLDFIKEFIAYARELNVDFPSSLDPYVKEFARELFEHGDNMIVEPSLRQVKGVVRIAKAIARMRLSKTASEEDIKEAIRLFKSIMFL